MGYGCFSHVSMPAYPSGRQIIVSPAPATLEDAGHECYIRSSCTYVWELDSDGMKMYGLFESGSLEMANSPYSTVWARRGLCTQPSPPPSPSAPPPSCSGGKTWVPDSPLVQPTCAVPNPTPSGYFVDRCACPGEELFDEAAGQCVDPVECPARSLPPPPPLNPPPSPYPPLYPNNSPDPPDDVCTAEQEAQNQPYCYHADFVPDICEYDDGIYCPERCGVCRIEYADPARNHAAQIDVIADAAIETINIPDVKQRLADALGISAARISIALSGASVRVLITIATVEGSPVAAEETAEAARKILETKEAASTVLGLSVEETSVLVAAGSPVAPPAPPPVESPKPKDGSVPIVATVIGAASSLVLVGLIGLVVCCMPVGPNRKGRDGYSPAPSNPSVVVYAGTAT